MSGYLVDSPEECAWGTVKLFAHPDKMLTMDEAARESVRHRFLLSRLALYYLKVSHAGMEAVSNRKIHEAKVL